MLTLLPLDIAGDMSLNNYQTVIHSRTSGVLISDDDDEVGRWIGESIRRVESRASLRGRFDHASAAHRFRAARC